jgi:hypothetical protein
MSNPDTFGPSTVLTVLRRERAVFEGNARRCRDPQQLDRYQQIIAAFTETIAHVEQTITESKPTRLEVAA